MTSFSAYRAIQELERELATLGMRLSSPRYGEYDTQATIVPIGNEGLPIYTRDAELATGTIEELMVWLRGVKWARSYDEQLRISNQAKREKKESLYLQKHLIDVLAHQE